MTWNEVLMYVIEVAFKLILTAGIPMVFALVKQKLHNDTQVKYLNMAEQMIHDAVVQVQQTYVSCLKADELFDRDAQIIAFNMAKDAVLKLMNEEMKEAVIDSVGDFETFINNKIEAEVYETKIHGALIETDFINDEDDTK